MAPIPNLALYQSLAARYFADSVKGKANPYTSMNGNMYSFLDKTGTVCLRMSGEDRARYQALFGTGPVEQYGSVMKEYVAISAAALNAPDDLQEAFSACRAYAASLPAK